MLVKAATEILSATIHMLYTTVTTRDRILLHAQ